MSILPKETVIDDDYPIYGDYVYLLDGKVTVSDYHGITAREFKARMGASEIRRCDLVARMNEEASHDFVAEIKRDRLPLYWSDVVSPWPMEGMTDVEAVTELGTYTISADQWVAGGTHYLWVAGNDSAEHDSEHRNMIEAKAAAQSDYEARNAEGRS